MVSIFIIYHANYTNFDLDRNSSLEYVENKQESHQQNSKVTNEVDNIMIRSDFSDEKEGHLILKSLSIHNYFKFLF